MNRKVLSFSRGQNPLSGGRTFSAPKTRFWEGGYLADIRRVSAGYPPDIRAPEESSGWIFRDVTDGTGSRLSLHWLEMPKSAVCVPSSNGSKGDNANIRQFYSDEFNLKQPC